MAEVCATGKREAMLIMEAMMSWEAARCESLLKVCAADN